MLYWVSVLAQTGMHRLYLKYITCGLVAHLCMHVERHHHDLHFRAIQIIYKHPYIIVLLSWLFCWIWLSLFGLFIRICVVLLLHAYWHIKRAFASIMGHVSLPYRLISATLVCYAVSTASMWMQTASCVPCYWVVSNRRARMLCCLCFVHALAKDLYAVVFHVGGWHC